MRFLMLFSHQSAPFGPKKGHLKQFWIYLPLHQVIQVFRWLRCVSNTAESRLRRVGYTGESFYRFFHTKTVSYWLKINIKSKNCLNMVIAIQIHYFDTLNFSKATIVQIDSAVYPTPGSLDSAVFDTPRSPFLEIEWDFVVYPTLGSQNSAVYPTMQSLDSVALDTPGSLFLDPFTQQYIHTGLKQAIVQKGLNIIITIWKHVFDPFIFSLATVFLKDSAVYPTPQSHFKTWITSWRSK